MSVMHYINKIKFGSISDKDVRNLSVKEIILPKAIDKDYNAISQGPHDLALGPLGFNDICITCGLNYYQCPGHLGHIELPMIIYNPMLFKTLYWILKGSCLFCFKLLAPRIQTLLITTQIEMLNYGFESAICDLNEILNNISINRSSEEKLDLKEIANNYYNELEDCFDKYMKKFLKEHLDAKNDTSPNKNILEIKDNIIKDYIKKYHLGTYKSCPHCQAKLPSIKIKDNSKIILLFAKRTSAKQSVQVNSDIKIDTNDNDALIWTKPSIKGEQSLMPLEAQNIIKNIFSISEQLRTMCSLFEIIKNKTTDDCSRIFFIKSLPVIPSKFRPVNAIGDSKFVGGQTLIYTKILAACQLLKETSGDLIGRYSGQSDYEASVKPSDEAPAATLVDSKNRSALQRFSFKSERQSVDLNEQSVKALLMVWQYLQACVNLLIEPDETLFPKEKLKGIKQILEKKEGLFRKHMMGKRVNFAARSVISPDPYIRVDEIGVPQIFAQKLTFPEPVNPYNVERLRQAIINGPAKYPGAYSVQNPDGSTVFLNPKRPEQRQAIARQISVPIPTTNKFSGFKMAPSHNANNVACPNPVQIVNRHLLDGDMLLLNRQPTLHKPSIMAHKARVLPGERTLRLHYAHCKAYNADFDGDEMNAHLPQSLPCASEARHVTGNQLIYLGPKDGRPLTGLIQDHLVAAVRMTVRGQFFGRADYHQLIYAALQGSPNLTKRGIKTQPPAILKPSRLWSGKQIISTILHNLIPDHSQPLNMYGKGKIKEELWSQKRSQQPDRTKLTPFLSEIQVVVRRGDWLTGIFDKSQFGASPFGLIHCCQELYGGQVASDILTSLGRVFTAYLQISGFTLGIKDILVNTKGDKVRKKVIKEGRTQIGTTLLKQVFGVDQEMSDMDELSKRWEKAFVTKEDKLLQEWETASKRATDHINNRISEYIMSQGLLASFPKNNLLLMVHSGAKGTLVNCMQICCLLGQIELEGRRPPMLLTGRTLPSFKPYDPTPRAHGFIDYRFLSGLKPQDYFFHCMAGREGLIDTAVKTSHSGYLQRCIIKHLEGLKVSYDSTVRDSDGSVIQFLYGEDGLEVTKSQYLVNGSEIEFLLSNHYIAAPPPEIKAVKASVDKKDLKAIKKEKRTSKKFPAMEVEPKTIEGKCSTMRPLISHYPPAKVFGSVSANLQTRIDGYESLFQTQPNPKQIQTDSIKSSPYPAIDFPSFFKNLEDVIYLKSMKSMVEPGEAVGLLCAQSIGEPSTQMTLNTFHFAGRGEMNVTLGIPRLREILMTATRNIKTPMMSAPFLLNISGAKRIQKISRNFQQIFYRQVITQVEVEESVLSDRCSKLREVYWVYRIRFNLLPYKSLKKLLPTCDKNSIHQGIERRLLPKLVQTIKKEDSCLNNIKLFESRKKLGIFLEGAALVEPSHDNKNTAEENDDADAQTDDAPTPASAAKDAHSSSDSSSSSDEDEDEERSRAGAYSDADADTAASVNGDGWECDTEGEGDDAAGQRSSVAPSSSGVSDMEDDAGSVKLKRKSPSFLRDDGLGTDDPDSGFPSPKKVSTSKKVKNLENTKDDNKNGPFGSQTDRQRIKNVLDISKYITHYAYGSGDQPWCEVTLQIPLSENKIDMEVLLEKEIKSTLFYHIPGVISSIVSEPDATTQCRTLQIQGINLPEMFKYGKSLDLNRVYCNDLHQILETYGIEACRNAIIKEVQKVFSAYGIQVDYRHLSLISDYMTFDGYYRPFNRYSMANQTSPFLKMSFESTFTFLKDALISGASDDLETPSARIVMGREIKTGTGCFDLMHKLL